MTVVPPSCRIHHSPCHIVNLFYLFIAASGPLNLDSYPLVTDCQLGDSFVDLF